MIILKNSLVFSLFFFFCFLGGFLSNIVIICFTNFSESVLDWPCEFSIFYNDQNEKLSNIVNLAQMNIKIFSLAVRLSIPLKLLFCYNDNKIAVVTIKYDVYYS